MIFARRYFALAALAVAIPLAPALTPAAAAFTPVSELKDVTPDHWAYAAIQSLVEKYEVMEGYEDKTFRGTKTLTRYEMAAALAKVMAKVEELISSATGNPISADPGVNKDDLRTIARLQREFRDELEVLKGRVDLLDTRVQTIEKRVRLSGELRNEYRTPLGAAPQALAPFDEQRVRARVNLDATLADEVNAHTSLFWDVYGFEGPGASFATRGPVGQAFTEMYLSKAYVSYTPERYAMHAGIANVSDLMPLGSALKNPFTQNVWREGLGGYGFVGTPGINLADPTNLARSTPQALNPTATTNPVWWLTGTDIALQAMDPNATQGIFPRGNYTAAASGEAGPFSLGVAVYSPGMAGRDLARLSALSYPTSLPQAETYGQGQRMITALGADFGFVRAQIAAKTPRLVFEDLGLFNKTLTGTVDVGSDALGLSLQTVARSAMTGQFTPTQASATLASNDLFGTGFGLGLGLNTGSIIDFGLRGTNEFVQQATPKSLLQGLSGTDYSCYGLALKVPGFAAFPSLTLAAQQTTGANFSGVIGSGLTLQADVKLWQLPLMQVEYSSGKFAPLTSGVENGLLESKSLVSNELLAVQMVVPF